jgi:uncharacterized OsmC-like protein
MPTIQSKYLGNLRTEAQHIQSGNQLITDAPKDNNGKGEAFSPTDLVSAALGSCMMTMMGIYARKEGIDMTGMQMNITKHMGSNPRKISGIDVEFTWKEPQATKEQIDQLKHIAQTCPVALSLSETVEQNIVFGF